MDLIGISANNLSQSSSDRFTLPPLISRIIGTERLFQVMISKRTIDPNDVSFNVIHMSKVEESPKVIETPVVQSQSSSVILFQSPFKKRSQQQLHEETESKSQEVGKQ